jgi:undecaprenyl-diphosphatase
MAVILFRFGLCIAVRFRFVWGAYGQSSVAGADRSASDTRGHARRDLGTAIPPCRSCRSSSDLALGAADAISRLGNSWLYLLIIPIVFGGLGREGFRVVFLGALNAALLHLMFPIIKRRIGRPRPFQADPRLRSLMNVLDEHSFPSGHTMTLSGVLTPIVLVWPGAILSALALMLLMAWSRVATAHHYPSDTFAGAIIGIVLAYPLSILVLALW